MRCKQYINVWKPQRLRPAKTSFSHYSYLGSVEPSVILRRPSSMDPINDLLQLCLQLPRVEAVCRLQRVLRVPAGKEHNC